MSPSARKALGSLALLVYMVLAIALAVVLAERFLTGAPWWAQLLFYLVAGVIWIAPLKPLFGWMNKRD